MTTFTYLPERFGALAASPIDEIAAAATDYHDALDALHAERLERDRVAAALEGADALDDAATLAAMVAGRPEPVLVDRDALTVRLADSERRVNARTTLAASLQLRAIDVATELAEDWAAAVKAQHAEARARYLAAIDAVRASADELDTLAGRAAAPAHLLDTNGVVRLKFLAGAVIGDDGGQRSRVTTALATLTPFRNLDEPVVEHAAPGAPMTAADLEFFGRTGDYNPAAAFSREADAIIAHL